MDDHEIGIQTRQLVSTFEAVVMEQLATSNPLTSADISFNRILHSPVGLCFLLQPQGLFTVAAGFPIKRKHSKKRAKRRDDPLQLFSPALPQLFAISRTCISSFSINAPAPS